jgi:hypothetical protein
LIVQNQKLKQLLLESLKHKPNSLHTIEACNVIERDVKHDLLCILQGEDISMGSYIVVSCAQETSTRQYSSPSHIPNLQIRNWPYSQEEEINQHI